MNKTQYAIYQIKSLGYEIEWCISPRGNKLCKAIKEGERTRYATTILSLLKVINMTKVID